MSEKSACGDGLPECKIPMKAECSFKGCEPFEKHDASYDVLYLGQPGRTLRDSKTHAFCGGGEGVKVLLTYPETEALSLNIEPCEGGLLFIKEGIYGKFTFDEDEITNTKDGLHKCKILPVPLEEATCFKQNFGRCGPDQVSLEYRNISINFLNGQCSWINPQCMFMTIEDSSASDSMFLVPVDGSDLLSENQEEFESLLQAAALAGEEHQIGLYPYLSLKCNTDQTWSFLSQDMR